LLRSPSSTVAGEAEHYLAQHPAPAATPAVDWWRENEQHFPKCHVCRKAISEGTTQTHVSCQWETLQCGKCTQIATIA